ncbi:MAG: substrate-binding domain-containing protein [Clostridia bacterium]|nr:substrate-binding domain-containing protein [Clostridia bacterium]
MTGSSRITRRRTLGILYREESDKGLTHPFFVLILNAFLAEAEKRGYDAAFLSHPLKEGYETLADHCVRAGVDGLCLVCTDFAHPQVKALMAGAFPCVSVDHIFRGKPAVLSDNETGVRKLVEFAIARGHRRIAMIHGHNNSLVTRTRISQFKNTMEYHRLPVPDAFLREGRYHDIGGTRNLVNQMLTLPEAPSCILLPDDMTYFGAQEAARDCGLKIPDDISFAGYDGIPLTQALKPRLTTIRQNAETLGKVAAARLMDLIEHPETAPKRPAIYPVELLEGETVAPFRPEAARP